MSHGIDAQKVAQAAKMIKRSQLHWAALDQALRADSKPENAKANEIRRQALVQMETHITQLTALVEMLDAKKSHRTQPLPKLENCTINEKKVYLRLLEHLKSGINSSFQSSEKMLDIVRNAFGASGAIKNMFRLAFLKRLLDQLSKLETDLKENDQQVSKSVKTLVGSTSNIGLLLQLKDQTLENAYLARMHGEISDKSRKITRMREKIIASEIEIQERLNQIKTRRISRPSGSNLPAIVLPPIPTSHPLGKYIHRDILDTQRQLTHIYQDVFANKKPGDFTLDMVNDVQKQLATPATT